MASEKNTGNDNEFGFHTRSRPASALFAGVKFLMNLEETHHFFKIFDAVDGKQNEANYQRYLKSEIGSKLDSDCVNFAEILSNQQYLESFPKGSLADCYLTFLDDENLSLNLLMDAEDEADSSTLAVDSSRRNYTASGIATHDLLHVVTSYRRDPIGEACLLVFTAEQFNLKGIGAFAHALAVREQVRMPKTRVMAMIKEAKERARNCVWVAEIDWRDELGRPIDEVRQRINFQPLRFYNGHKPKSVKKHSPKSTIDRSAA